MNVFHVVIYFFFFSSRRRHTRCSRDWSSDVCSSDLSEIRKFNEALPIGGSYSPYPAELEVSPLVLTFNGVYGISRPISGALMLTATPLSHFHTDFELPDVSLKDFVLDKQTVDSHF